jgi:MFS family permease
MKMPELPTETIKNLKASLIDIIGNGKLAGFSVYLFFLYAASGSTLPTIFIFAKDSLNTPDNIVVVISTLALVGMLAGYLAGGLFVDRCGVKTIFLSAHIAFGILNIAMLCVASSSLSAIIFICTLVTIYGFLLACASIAVSSEMMALAPQNNKAMSMAFCFSLYSAGFGASRLLTSFVLGSGMLSSSWKAFGYSFTQFHSLFLFYGFAVLFACVLLVLVPAFVQGARRLPFR